jgi:hypothetical protein
MNRNALDICYRVKEYFPAYPHGHNKSSIVQCFRDIGVGQFVNVFYLRQLFRNRLRGIQQIKGRICSRLSSTTCPPNFPFKMVAALTGFPLTVMRVGIRTVNFLPLVKSGIVPLLSILNS